MHESVSRSEDATGTAVGLPEFGLRETGFGRRRTEWSYFCLNTAVDTDMSPDILTTLICVGFEVSHGSDYVGYCAVKCERSLFTFREEHISSMFEV
jgi:hypothetical protein